MKDEANFDSVADAYDRSRALPHHHLTSLVQVLLEQYITTADRCIDVGCGTGQLSAPFVAAGFPVTGVDISANMGLHASKKIPGYEFVLGDATSLPFPENNFSFGISSKLFMHVPDWKRAVREIVRVVHPGGYFLNVHEVGAFDNRVRKHFTAGSEQLGYTSRFKGEIDQAVVAEYFLSLGAKRLSNPLPDTAYERTVQYNDVLQDLERKHFAEFWGMSDDDYAECLSKTREWLQGIPASEERLTPHLDIQLFELP